LKAPQNKKRIKPKPYILPVIVIAQFFCTSLWFAGNGVMTDIISEFSLGDSALWTLTTLVQLGFISGTLLFALLTIVDRFSPSNVFLTCAILGATVNAGMLWEENSLSTLLILRFFTGFFLAGIYPVGMKIASDYYKNGLCKALGFLVGALVLGTALPHLLKDIASDLPWQSVIIAISLLSLVGGALMMLFIPDGPYRTAGKKLKLTSIYIIFRNRDFKVAALGYFGHMWELYAFWVFVPLIITTYINRTPQLEFDLPIFSFIIIAVGAVGCIAAGYLGAHFGTKKTAFLFLLASLICCLVSPYFFTTQSTLAFILFMLFWGFAVVGDSPLFSSLVANSATPALKGTAITIVTCMGFAITIISIELLGLLATAMGIRFMFMILAIGPFISLLYFVSEIFKNRKKV
jgi:MFS family permease